VKATDRSKDAITELFFYELANAEQTVAQPFTNVERERANIGFGNFNSTAENNVANNDVVRVAVERRRQHVEGLSLALSVLITNESHTIKDGAKSRTSDNLDITANKLLKGTKLDSLRLKLDRFYTSVSTDGEQSILFHFLSFLGACHRAPKQ